MKLSARNSLPARLALALLLGGLALAQSQMGANPALTASPSFTLSGALSPRSFTPEDLRVLPATQLSVEYRADGKMVKHLYTGVLLYSLLTAAKPQFDARMKNDALRYYLLARGNDGYTALLSWGELDPGFGNKQVLVAYAQDGQPIAGNQGSLRLVVPGEVRGGRSVSALSSVQLLRGGQ